MEYLLLRPSFLLRLYEFNGLIKDLEIFDELNLWQKNFIYELNTLFVPQALDPFGEVSINFTATHFAQIENVAKT